MKKFSQNFISYEKLNYLLLFLFPIAGMLVHGWLTNIFNLLFLLGLLYLSRRTESLHKEDRAFLYICAAYVSIYILSGIVNGWGPIQTHDLGTELRFWMIIPIYLLVRERHSSWRWLLLGCLLGIVFIFVQAYYEVYWLGKPTAWGAYSKNIIGPFSALLGFWVLFLWKQFSSYYQKAVIVLAFFLAMLATAMSGSRGAYVGFVVMLCVWLFMYIRLRYVLVAMILALGGITLIYQKVAIVHEGTNAAIAGFKAYMQEPDIASSKIVMRSTEIHLEMWRATKYFVSDYPVLGVGPGNYEITAQKYAREGKVNPVIGNYSHPHNIFLEALCSKGLVGLICLLLLIYYPFFVMFRTRKLSVDSANLGMLNIIGMTAFSMFDASPILYNNYVSILLLGIAVFFSHHLYQVRMKRSVHA